MWRGRSEGPNTNTSTSTEVLIGDFEDFLRMEGGTKRGRDFSSVAGVIPAWRQKPGGLRRLKVRLAAVWQR